MCWSCGKAANVFLRPQVGLSCFSRPTLNFISDSFVCGYFWVCYLVRISRDGCEGNINQFGLSCAPVNNVFCSAKVQ